MFQRKISGLGKKIRRGDSRELFFSTNVNDLEEKAKKIASESLNIASDEHICRNVGEASQLCEEIMQNIYFKIPATILKWCSELKQEKEEYYITIIQPADKDNKNSNRNIEEKVNNTVQENDWSDWSYAAPSGEASSLSAQDQEPLNVTTIEKKFNKHELYDYACEEIKKFEDLVKDYRNKMSSLLEKLKEKESLTTTITESSDNSASTSSSQSPLLSKQRLFSSSAPSRMPSSMPPLPPLPENSEKKSGKKSSSKNLAVIKEGSAPVGRKRPNS
ncbi:MAG: hypothetical protein KIT56_04460 [Gammaproteobacteria bacterium]|nr:hypothetical protein [Gammaproteobacteria bacterium]MCW5583130.1 hypothetical protein [Gammaproteobacteria bacterium]